MASTAGLLVCFVCLAIIIILFFKQERIPIIPYTLDIYRYAPLKAHKSDAGYDLRSPGNFEIAPHSYVTIKTGVHVLLPEGTVGFIKSKSGLNINRNLISEGVIDAGYTGEIIVKIRNTGDFPVYLSRGDKFTQLVILPCYETKLNYTKDWKYKTERGNQGFGSSGK